MATSYRPTALERAYASHLLQTYFQTPHSSDNNIDNIDNTPLRIPGRQAVPFLTTSGVERTLLRLFWSVVDPEAVGTLVVRNQFQVLLRLVAMAQAHFLPPLTTATTAGEIMTDADKIAVLTKTLQANSHLVIALPTFSADAQMPSVAYLLATFPSRMSSTTNNNENSMLDYSNINENNNNVIMSVSDAFGSLTEVEDRPLPSLQFDSAPTTTAAVEDVTSLPVVDDSEVATGSIAPEKETMTENNMGEWGTNDEDFGDFDDSTNRMGSDDNNPMYSTATAVVENDQDIDDFGGFESTAPNSNNNGSFSDVKTESSAEDESKEEAENNMNDADFGDFSDSFPPPPPPVAAEADEIMMTLTENNVVPTIAGSNMIDQITAVGNGSAGTTTLSISDAFGSLVGQEDPSIQFGQMNAFGDANVGKDSDNVEENDDDDFGNFGSADTAAAAPSIQVSKAHDDEEFASNNIGTSVFDAFGDAEDKPLPSFGGGFPSISNETGATNSEEAEVDDDGFGFGSFEATVEAEVSNNVDDAPVDDNFGNFEDAAAVTTAAIEEIVNAPVEDSFGSFAGAGVDDNIGNFEGAATVTTMAIEGTVDAPVEDSFGSFGGAGGGDVDVAELEQNTDSQSEIPATNSCLPPSPPQSDPFGSLPEVENLPLPPLTSPFYEEKKSLDVPTTKVDEGDDFGDFDSPDAPDASGPSSHSEVKKPEQMMVSNDDDFGGFESTPVATEIKGEMKSNDDIVEDDFGAFGESTVLPLNDTSPQVASSEQPLPAPAIDANSVSFSEEKKSHEDADIGRIVATSRDKADGEEPKLSFGMSAFDAFGDIEDAPLPPLNDFASSTNNEIEATETGEVDGNDNDESFGSFGAVETEPNIDAAVDGSFAAFEDAASIAETPNVEVPVDESFGTFEGVAEENAEAEPAVDESFGTFEGVAGEATEAEPAVDDSFGTFEGEPQETDQVEANVDGGEKKIAEVEQEITLQTEVPATSFGLPSPSPSDPFGSLPEIENLPLPPLTSPPLVERKLEDAALEVENNTLDSENDGFGDFGSVPVDDGTRNVLPHESEQMDEDAFGGFESTTPQVQANEDVIFSTTNRTNDNTIGALSETHGEDDFGDFGEAEVPAPSLDTALAENDDDFGDFGDPAPPLDATLTGVDAAKNEEDFGNFGEAEVAAPSLDATSTEVDAAENEEDDFGDFGEAEVAAPPLDATSTEGDAALNEDDDFGDFGNAPIPAPPLYTASTEGDAAVNEDDEFGDFGNAPIPAPPLYTASEEVVAEENNDDFGDFGEAEGPAPPLDAASTGIDNAANTNNTDDADDFGFGDWGSGDWQGQAPEGNDSAAALVPDILSGGFDALSAPAPALSGTDEQSTPTIPNGDNGDEFGSFEAPKSGVTQDEGSDGFVFVENTESDSQVEAFGDFSSPANESFSAFDSGADEENITQPKLEEENTDGFGDFSSFDNGAEEQVVNQGSQKSSLSRHELIGSEYTNLMERWANIASTVKSDVARGQKIIDFISKTLPSSDRAIIFKSSKLQNHMLGLAEFVRVVRCIAATIADVFCLSDNIDLQASHLAEWNDNPIIADAITIETLWSEISSRLVELSILPQPPQLETVMEIRARAKIATVMHKADLCHLTLQPFADKPCTQSSVDWNDNKYMACAANLLLHRMS